MTMAILGKNILRLIPNILRYNGLMFSRVFFFMMLNDANINRIGYNFVDCQKIPDLATMRNIPNGNPTTCFLSSHVQCCCDQTARTHFTLKIGKMIH